MRFVLSRQEEKILWEAMKHETGLRDLITNVSGLEKIKLVRVWLRENMPEVREIPVEDDGRYRIGFPLSPEFKIASAIVELLS